MTAVHKDLTPVGFERPANIVDVQVCRKSGKLPGSNCPPSDIVTDVFLKGTEPSQTCTTHVSAQVCLDDPLHLASDNCPADRLVWRTFIRRDPYVPYITGDGTILVPQDASQELPREECRIHGGMSGFIPDRVIEVRLSAFTFSPSSIQVARGTRVRLALTSTDRTYSMAIQGYSLSSLCPVGQTVYLDFIADQAGTFTYYCNMDVGKPEERAKMVGRLVVN
jgi:plastocyanin